MMPSRRFQRRIILIVLLFGGAMILLNNGRDQGWLVERGLQRLEQEAEDTASRLSGLLQHLTRRQQESAAELEMSYLALAPNVEIGVICDLKGRIVYATKAHWRGRAIAQTAVAGDWPLISRAFASMNTLKAWDSETGRRHLTVVAPFYESYDAESKAAVVVRYDATRAVSNARAAATREALRQALVLMALCLLLWFALDVLVVQLRQAENLVLDIAEQERRKIGGDLHDDLCQRLTATKFKAELVRELLPDASPKIAELSQQVADELSESVVIARGMAHGLSPVGLEQYGLGDALEELARLVERSYGLTCPVEVEDVQERLPVSAQELLFRVAQELVVNAAKHSKPQSIHVSLRTGGDHLVLSVIHDGIPFDDKTGGKGRGMGLELMRKRLHTLAATMQRTVEDGNPKISIATVRIPLNKSPA